MQIPSHRLLQKLVIAACSLTAAGCSTLHLLNGVLKSDDGISTVARPYPGWDAKAKETLARIPTTGEQPSKPAASAATVAPSPVTTATTASPASAAVAPEQAATSNPAQSSTAPAAAAKVPVTLPSAMPPPAAAVVAALAPSPTQPQRDAQVERAMLELVTSERHGPLSVNDVVADIPAAKRTGPEPAKDAKAEIPAAERLAALVKQRGELLASLKDEIERRRTKDAGDLELPRMEQELRLLYLAADRPDEALEQIEALDGAEREAFVHLLMGLATWMDLGESSHQSLRNAKVLREIRSAAAQLAAASKLDVRNIAFCEKVESYGWYTEFSRNQFKPKQQLVLYLEVENFTAEKIGDHSYETELQASYQIFDARGNLVDERQLPRDREVCRNPRRDYFLASRIYLPDTIEPGNYRLELTVEDLKGSADLRTAAEGSRPGVRQANAAEPLPKANNAYKGRKLGEGSIEFTVKN